MIVTFSDGKRSTNRKKLNSTSFQTLVECGTKEAKMVEGLIVSCDATATDFTMVFTDEDGTDFTIYNEYAIGANETFIPSDFPHLPVYPSQSLRIKASIASHLTVIAITIDAITVEAPKGGGAGYNGTGGGMIGWRGA